MRGEYRGFTPGEELGLPLQSFDEVSSKRDEFSEAKLREMGIHPHFTEFEIETKLNIGHGDFSPEAAMELLKVALKRHGYRFIGANEVRENVVVYYNKHDNHGHKGKIVVRNWGKSGFQVKQKSESLYSDRKHILIKQERKSPVFSSLAEAENYLAAKMDVSDAKSYRESVVKRKACKATLIARGNDSVTRYFRLVADETGLPHENDGDKLNQVELEYKGSDSESNDDIGSIGDQMEEIVAAIEKEKPFKVKRTTDSKRGWANKKRGK